MTLKFLQVDDRYVNDAFGIFRSVVARGDSYIYDADTTIEQFRHIWLTASCARPYVAVDEESSDVVGTFVIRQNKAGRGSHVANAGFMVRSDRRGRGVGSAMCEFAMTEAKKIGYLSMQFNVVVSTNLPAVNLWQKMGFKIVGTVTGGYLHEEFGYVDIYIMWREL